VIICSLSPPTLPCGYESKSAFFDQTKQRNEIALTALTRPPPNVCMELGRDSAFSNPLMHHTIFLPEFLQICDHRLLQIRGRD
jgi:hypothetical protein